MLHVVKAQQQRSFFRHRFEHAEQGFAETQIVTPAQFESVKFPDLEAIGTNRRDWTLRWQEIIA